MKFKKYLFIGTLIIFSIVAFSLGREYSLIKRASLEAISQDDNYKDFIIEEADTLTEEQKRIKNIILEDTKGLFLLVNEENPIDKMYGPESLVVPNITLVGKSEEPRNKVNSIIKEDLERMFSDSEKDGMEMYLSCAHRSYEEQEYLYNRALERENSDSSELVALPGRSEHQLGLAVDITTSSIDFQLEEAFEDTKEGKWLLENAHKYGFILRYLKGKEDITGYTYEPWHYRYIGNVEISTYCHKNNLTLEELYEELGINTK
ncbi:M15 family metallopeptidase [Clostridium sp. B9]|uniref:M15 family metallopeptidase n=1 Tax=Clostridium sp. B9 TaxID=3423224 RepID=UPI003D2EB331